MMHKAENDILEIVHVLKNVANVLASEDGVRIDGESMANLRKALQSHFESQNAMNVADFKRMSCLTRKFAIPVLEYCDKQGWTERDGNVRIKGNME